MASGSSLTTSTRGGVSFDELCRGEVKSYSFNLVDLRKKKTTQRRIDALRGKIADTLQSLQTQSEKEIESFCIGKTYAERKTGKVFKPTDKNTWRVGGISDRWRNKYKKEGYDGLVVLGAVTRAMLNSKGDTKCWNQQKYALALESTLIIHYAYEDCDKRLANTTLEPGMLQGKESAGYVVYVAFKYAQKGN